MLDYDTTILRTGTVHYKRKKYQAIMQLIFLVLVLNIKANCSQPGRDMYYAGSKFPSEKKTYEDSVTGLEITMLTTSPAKDDKIY